MESKSFDIDSVCVASPVKQRMAESKAGIAVLPIHDSFLMPESKADFLEDVGSGLRIGLDEIKIGHQSLQESGRN